METIVLKEEPKGTLSCELPISVEEWEEMLCDKNIVTTNIKAALLSFYRQPEHKSTCGTLSEKQTGSGKDGQSFNALIGGLGASVIKHLNRFKIVDEFEKEKFWPVSMNPGRELENNRFEWTLRPELVEAIENLGWNKRFSWIEFYQEMADKLLLFKDRRDELVDIIYQLDEKFSGYIKGVDGKVNDIDPFSTFAILNRGMTDLNRIKVAQHFKEKFDIVAEVPADFDSIPIVNSQRATFYSREHADTDIQPLWNLFEAVVTDNKEDVRKLFDVVLKQHGVKWNITMGMYWVRPYDYIALDSRNREYLPKIGIEVFAEKDFDYNHYEALLTNVKNAIDNHSIEEMNIPEISYNAWVASEDRAYWLVGYAFGATNSQIGRFFDENIWEGGFYDNKPVDVSQQKLAAKIKVGDVLIYKSTATKGKNHQIPFLRVKAVAVVTSDIEKTTKGDLSFYRCSVKYLSTDIKDFVGASFGAYRKTIHQSDSKAQKVVEYANSLLEGTPIEIADSESPANEPIQEAMPIPSKYEEIIKLLKSCKNLVLTGAPGTGKTYMAREIAKYMGAEVQFVQFHPSFDYTDFVEGLRPVDNGTGQIGFERKDGFFKEFCREAIKNVVDSEKSVVSLSKELSWKEKLDKYIDDAIEQKKKLVLTNGNEFYLEEVKRNSVIAHNDQNEKTTLVSVNLDEILELLSDEIPLNVIRDIREHFGHKYSTQSDSYSFVITKDIRKCMKAEPVKNVQKVALKPFVFIIDEINRGEASKIFGELFYAIDPGYRGKSDVLVQTQYQNLVPESDVFAKGFYVPENVYILATMNDIDRSVESMDFAMRRRFTWKEVTPDVTEDMLESLNEPLATKAKECMKRLNTEISTADGLGAAFMIGPSYFLKLKDFGGNFDELWEMCIEPLLKEYLRGFRKVDETMKKFKRAFNNEEEASKSDKE